MINKDGGGGQFLDFMGGHSCYEGGHRAHGGSLSPPTGENPGSHCTSEVCTMILCGPNFVVSRYRDPKFTTWLPRPDDHNRFFFVANVSLFLGSGNLSL